VRRALLELLAFQPRAAERPVLSLLLDEARKKTVRIWAADAPFDLKHELKKRRYRWSDGSDGRPRSWFVDVVEDRRIEEIEFLRKEIYRSEANPKWTKSTRLCGFPFGPDADKPTQRAVG